MSSLSSFPAPMSVAVVGASGGIGAEFIRQLEANKRVGALLAFSRGISTADSTSRTQHVSLNFYDECSVSAAVDVAASAGPFDLVVVASGLLHNDKVQPEKRLNDIDAEAMQEVLRVNTVGPALAAKYFLPLMRSKSKSVFAALSARVGSISDNRLGGWVSYRASKAALNMVLRTAAIEHRRRFPESIIAALHPGTVDTALSAPFQSNVPNGKLFAPAFSVERLLDVVDKLRPTDSGGFFAWDGTSIEF